MNLYKHCLEGKMTKGQKEALTGTYHREYGHSSILSSHTFINSNHMTSYNFSVTLLGNVTALDN